MCTHTHSGEGAGRISETLGKDNQAEEDNQEKMATVGEEFHKGKSTLIK